MRILLLTLFAVTTMACVSNENGDDSGGGGGAVDDPTFANVQTLILSPTCTDSSCHDSSAGGGLVLTAGNSYDALVNVPVTQINASGRGKILVIPGDPDNSFLLQKLTRTMESDEGDAMPRNEESLSSTKIALIREWIQDGALDN